MSDSDDLEGLDFDAIFAKRGKPYAAREDRQARLKAERRAGMTAKQRDRLGPPKKQVNFRASDEVRDLIDKLCRHFDRDKTNLIIFALEQLADTVPGIRERQ